jgi:lactate racemase
MRILMHYGKRGLPLDISGNIDPTIIRKRPMPLLDDPEGAVRSALTHPVGSLTLKEEAKGCRSACILICDVTRPVPNGLILPALIREVMDGGVHPSTITVLIATGLHRPNMGDELCEVVGSQWVLESVRVENHVARNDEDHVYLGTTPRGVPVRLDRRLVDADLRIVVGLVEPHFMAGYSGGRKVIIPGVSHHDTIGALHSTRLLTQVGVTNCVLEGNPLHEEQLSGIRMMAGGCLGVNAVIDEERRLSFVNFGDVEESHFAAVAFARPYFEVPVNRKFATVVTSAAGYPLDRNYYQTVKSMVSVAGIVEPVSDVFVVSECSEGLGTDEYALSQSRLVEIGMDAFLSETSAKKCAAVDEWETVMQIKAMKAGRMHLFSACLTPDQKALTHVHVVEEPLVGAIEECVKSKHDKRVAFVPEGPYVIPFYRPADEGSK